MCILPGHAADPARLFLKFSAETTDREMPAQLPALQPGEFLFLFFADEVSGFFAGYV